MYKLEKYKNQLSEISLRALWKKILQFYHALIYIEYSCSVCQQIEDGKTPQWKQEQPRTHESQTPCLRARKFRRLTAGYHFSTEIQKYKKQHYIKK